MTPNNANVLLATIACLVGLATFILLVFDRTMGASKKTNDSLAQFAEQFKSISLQLQDTRGREAGMTCETIRSSDAMNRHLESTDLRVGLLGVEVGRNAERLAGLESAHRERVGNQKPCP